MEQHWTVEEGQDCEYCWVYGDVSHFCRLRMQLLRAELGRFEDKRLRHRASEHPEKTAAQHKGSGDIFIYISSSNKTHLQRGSGSVHSRRRPFLKAGFKMVFGERRFLKSRPAVVSVVHLQLTWHASC